MAEIRKLLKNCNNFIIGIDEAGRGPLAGPVSVGTFAIKLNSKEKFIIAKREALKQFRGVKDSKQLSEKQREEWLAKIKVVSNSKKFTKNLKNSHEVFWAVSFSGAKTIDEKGLSYSIRSALNRSLKKLELSISRKSEDIKGASSRFFLPLHSLVLLDGSLYAPERYINQKTIIDGDAKEPIIALASICAKVLRDKKMKNFAKKYPHYGFEIHKGYGTKSHYVAIKKYGISQIHRKSFLKKIFNT